MADVTEVNALTGDVIVRPFTPEELAQKEIDAAEVAKRQQAEADAFAARETALSKLAALGLTVDDLTALGL